MTRDKGHLVQNRLAGLLRDHGLADTADLVAALRKGDDDLAVHVVDAMMSRETAFFRDWKPFKHLAKVVLPNLRRAGREAAAPRIRRPAAHPARKPIRVAMQVIEDAQIFSGWQVDIVGIDVSPAAITAAEHGVYTQFEVQRGLPIRRLLRHFTCATARPGGSRTTSSAWYRSAAGTCSTNSFPLRAV